MQPKHINLLGVLLGIFIQHKIALAGDFRYFDVTEPINRRNDTEIQNALKMTRSLYYSTGNYCTP